MKRFRRKIDFGIRGFSYKELAWANQEEWDRRCSTAIAAVKSFAP